MKRLLGVGAAAGLAAGAAMAAFTATVGRAPIRAAVEYEQGLARDHRAGAVAHVYDRLLSAARDHRAGAVAHEDLFSRGAQEIGGAIGLVIFGLGLGIVFAIVLGSVGSQLRAATAMAATCQLAAAGFATTVLVPFLRYPANPPAVGDPDTVARRTLLYFAAVAASLALTLIVWRLWRRGAAWPTAARAWAAAAAYGAGLAALLIGLPDAGAAADAPADLVWSFRLVSLGGLAVAWAVLGLVAGTLLVRTAPASA